MDSNIYKFNEWTRPYPIPPKEINLGLLEIGHYVCSEGELYPEEVAVYSAIIWCIEGELTYHCETRDLIVQAGEACIISPRTRYSTTCKGKKTDFWYLALDGKAAETVITGAELWEGVFPYLNVPYKWLNYLAGEIDKLERQTTLAGLGQSLFELLKSDIDNILTDKLAWEAESIINRKWNDPKLNINKLINELHTTSSTLTPRFKKLSGYTPLEYLNNIRYRNALDLLRSTSLHCNEIAFSCGFEDSAYFSRWFKRINGKSPSEFRK